MENDINRALTFWEKESLLKVVDDVIILNQSTKQKNEIKQVNETETKKMKRKLKEKEKESKAKCANNQVT